MTCSHYQIRLPKPETEVLSPSVGEHYVAIMDLFHCSFLDDLISDDNPISYVIVDFATECILRL